MQRFQTSFISGQGWKIPLDAKLDSDQTAVFVFFSKDLANGKGQLINNDLSRALEEIHSVFKNSHLIGCSTSGEIAKDKVQDKSISILALKFHQTKIASFEETVESTSDSKRAGEAIGQKLDAKELAGAVILTDGMVVNGTELLMGINQNLSKKVPLAGGLAGDGNNFIQTLTDYKGKVRSAGRVIALGLYGTDIVFSASAAGGWEKFGPVRVVTKSSGSTVYEIDGEPALALYKRYLGNKASELPSSALYFPLALTAGDQTKTTLVRTILSVDEEKQSLTFAGTVPENSSVTFMRCNKDRLIDRVVEIFDNIKAKTDQTNQGALLLFSCVGRRLVLGERTQEEVETIVECFDPEVPIAGFYTYGEIAPLSDDPVSQLHNETMTGVYIAEVKKSA